jgi:hypothetical protein
LYSDVQVTFANGSTKDLIQKAFPITNFIAAGFAGSVRIGYTLLQSLADHLALPPEALDSVAWDPLWVFETWAPIAKSVFDKSPPLEKKAGSQFLIVGVSPQENNGPFPKVYFCRLSYPDFKPGVMRRNIKMCSIGSGAGVAEYKRAIKPLFRLSSGILHAEIGHPGGWAQQLGFSISRILNDYPRRGISRHLHIVTMMRGTMYVSTNDEKIHVGDSLPIEITIPPVAQGYDAFLALAEATGQDGAGAMC